MQGNGESELRQSSGGKDQPSGSGGFFLCSVGVLDTPPISRAGAGTKH